MGRCYVVEFWATWCGPCRSSMPHISQLQDRLWARRNVCRRERRDPRRRCKSFFDEVQDPENGTTWNDAITYTIALDDADENTGQGLHAGRSAKRYPDGFCRRAGRTHRMDWSSHEAR